MPFLGVQKMFARTNLSTVPETNAVSFKYFKYSFNISKESRTTSTISGSSFWMYDFQKKLNRNALHFRKNKKFNYCTKKIDAVVCRLIL